MLVAAAVLAVSGVLFILLGKLGIGRLPGDFSWRGDRVSVFLPLGTMLLLSIVASILLNLFLRR